MEYLFHRGFLEIQILVNLSSTPSLEAVLCGFLNGFVAHRFGRQTTCKTAHFGQSLNRLVVGRLLCQRSNERL
jgi:hypothetical protein